LLKSSQSLRGHIYNNRWSLKVRSSLPEQGGIIAQLTDSDVALRAKNPAYTAGDVIVVDVPLERLVQLDWRLADGTGTVLPSQQRVERLLIDPVDAFHHVSTSMPRMRSMPVLHRTASGAELGVVSHVGDVNSTTQANVGLSWRTILSTKRAPEIVQAVATPPASSDRCLLYDARLEGGFGQHLLAGGTRQHLAKG
jgi:hypothetical protein